VNLYLEGADSIVLLLKKKGHSIVSLLYSAEVLSREPDRPFADPEKHSGVQNILGHFILARSICVLLK
jgi:hypothetical protein